MKYVFSEIKICNNEYYTSYNYDLDKLFSVIISLFVSINIYVNLDKLLLNCYPYNLICNDIGLYAISFVLSR